MPIAYSASVKAGVGFRPFMYLCMFMASISYFNIPMARYPFLSLAYPP